MTVSRAKTMLKRLCIFLLLLSAGSVCFAKRNYAKPVRQAIHSTVLVSRQRHLDPLTRNTVGSGVILDRSGYVVTCAHVIGASKVVKVQLYDGRRAQAQVVAQDKETDLALLKLRLRNLRPIKRSQAGEVGVGSTVYAIGNPFGSGHVVTKGVVSALNRSLLAVNQLESYIQFDASINPGNSGGALINRKGELVGIVAAILNEPSIKTQAYAIPLYTVNNIVSQLKSGRPIIRGTLGLEVKTMSAHWAKAYALPNYQGVVVTRLHSKQARERLKKHDIIIRINQAPVRTARNFNSAILTRRPHSRVLLTVIRQRQQLQVEVEVQPLRWSDDQHGSGEAKSTISNQGFLPDRR